MVIVLLIFEVFIFGYIDYKIYGTYYTPTLIVSTPFVLVIFFNLFLAKSAGLIQLFMPSLWVWVIGLFFFWLSGILLAIVFIRKLGHIYKPFAYLSVINTGLVQFFRLLSLILIFVMYFKLIDSLLKFSYGSERFSLTLSGGLASHASIWLLIPVTFFLIISDFSRKSLLNWLIILLWLIFAFGYNSKTWILIPLIASIIGRVIINNHKISLWKILFLVGLGILIFYLSYSVSFGYWASWAFIKNYFVFYTNAGLLSFSEYVRLKSEIGISLEFLFEPFFNIYYKVTGQEMVSIISELKVNIGNNYVSNVKTFFGEIYIYGGVVGGIFTTFIWGGFCYLYLILNLLLKDFTLFIIYLILIAALFFGWFGIYYNNLSYYELIFASTVIVIATTFILKKGKLILLKY